MEEKKGIIRSTYEIEVMRACKGELPQKIDLSCIGGTVPYTEYLKTQPNLKSVPDEGYRYAHSEPERQIQIGQEHLFFVTDSKSENLYFPVAGEHSMLPLKEDSRGVRVYRTDLAKYELLDDFLSRISEP